MDAGAEVVLVQGSGLPDGAGAAAGAGGPVSPSTPGISIGADQSERVVPAGALLMICPWV